MPRVARAENKSGCGTGWTTVIPEREIRATQLASDSLPHETLTRHR